MGHMEKSTKHTVERLVREAADSANAGKVRRIAFDEEQAAMAWMPHWPKDAIFPPGHYCTPRYMVVDFIARGGIAEVYEARDMIEETLVALKVVRTEGKERAEVLEKFAAEARTFKEIKHSNLLRVFDAGFIEDRGLLFFSMERLIGATLHDLIYRSRGPRMLPREPALPLLQVVKMAIDVGRGVNALHEQDTIHRDIKPENLFWTRDGEGKVFDLDVAKFNRNCALRTTRRGYTMGTVLYMSPEHLNHGKTDRRSDIYAVGLVIFELIAGHHAFASNPDEALAQTDIIAWHSARMPPILSNLIQGVPIAFDAIIGKCAAKDPAARYPSCGELLADLLSLQSALLQAEARKEAAAAQAPDLVVRVEGTAPSPKLAQATTGRAMTAVPSTPLQLLPPPLFDTPPAVAITAPEPEPTRVGESGMRRVEATSHGTGEDAAPSSPARGPRGTEIIPTSSRTANGTERISLPAPEPVRTPPDERARREARTAPIETESTPGEAHSAQPAATRTPVSAGMIIAGEPARAGQAAIAPQSERRSVLWICSACVIAAVAVTSAGWWLALRGHLSELAPPRMQAPAPIASSAPAPVVPAMPLSSAPSSLTSSLTSSAPAEPAEPAPRVTAAAPAKSGAKAPQAKPARTAAPAPVSPSARPRPITVGDPDLFGGGGRGRK